MIIAATKRLAQEGGMFNMLCFGGCCPRKKFLDLGLGVPPQSQVSWFVRVNAHLDAFDNYVIVGHLMFPVKIVVSVVYP